ncbi:argininosuccinate lyase [Micromonospora sp. ALFpr18c]|nr:argininosuccinate lyase [Micromonospora sp. ALFpr18c]
MAAIGASAHYDGRLARYDVLVSRAHVTMLLRQGIVESEIGTTLLATLTELDDLLRAGGSPLDPGAEDVHTAVEEYLEARIGPGAGWLGTARARNDLAVTALRLWLRDRTTELGAKILAVVDALVTQAERHAATVMPGFSHLQVAQPLTFGHVCLAYAAALLRDAERMLTARAAQDECPLGSAALAGTGFPIDRKAVAEALGFRSPTLNSLDSVGDRGFALDFLNAGSCLALDLSRLGAELVFWSSQPVGLVRLPDELVTSSSALPHKRNPDAAELLRGKSGRVLGNQHTLQTVVKGLPLSYFRDLQEDKEPLFDSADTLATALDTALALVTLLEPDAAAMRRAVDVAFLTSSDLADWLTRERGVPFREAHHLVAALVRLATQRGTTLTGLSPEDRLGVDPRLAGDWPDLSVEASVAARDSPGGTAPKRVAEAAAALRSRRAELAQRIDEHCVIVYEGETGK